MEKKFIKDEYYITQDRDVQGLIVKCTKTALGSGTCFCGIVENSGNSARYTTGYEGGRWLKARFEKIGVKANIEDENDGEDEESSDSISVISRANLKKIWEALEDYWLEEMVEEIATRDLFGNMIELTRQEIDQLYSTSNENTLIILRQFFAEPKKKLDVDVTNFAGSISFFDNSKFSECASLNESHIVIQKNSNGNMKDFSFILSSRYDWKLVEDDLNCLCLVPTNKTTNGK